MEEQGLQVNHEVTSRTNSISEAWRRLLFGVLLACLVPAASAATATANQTLSVALGPIGKVAVVQSSVLLAHTGTIFADFTGSITVQYELRTTIASGSSSLTVKAGSEFSPATGPSIARGDLTYTCGGATIGAACSGSQIVGTGSQTSVITVGSGACTGTGCAGSNPDSAIVNLTLVDNPAFKTGTYSTNLIFSISAL
jgi:hypothetical protein